MIKTHRWMETHYMPRACVIIPTMRRSVNCRVEYETTLEALEYDTSFKNFCSPILQSGDDGTVNRKCSLFLDFSSRETHTVVFKTSPLCGRLGRGNAGNITSN